MIWFIFLFCLLFRCSILHRVLLVAGWCQVLYSSGFHCVSSHYLIPPRVSSLVVWGLGVSAPTPKAQSLSLSFAWVHIIVFCWSGTPVCSQLVFCMYFCVWRCIPAVSVERDVLHVHLPLCHLVLRLDAYSVLNWVGSYQVSEEITEHLSQQGWVCC